MEHPGFILGTTCLSILLPRWSWLNADNSHIYIVWQVLPYENFIPGSLTAYFGTSKLQISPALNDICLQINAYFSLTHFSLYHSSCYLGPAPCYYPWSLSFFSHDTLSCLTWPLLFLWPHLLNSQPLVIHSVPATLPFHAVPLH